MENDSVLSRFTKADFESARGRREAFAKLDFNKKDVNGKLVEQFIVIGNNNTDSDEAQALYRYPDIDLEDFDYRIISLYCFPKGIRKVLKEAISTEDLFQIQKKAKEGCVNVTNFFTLKMASPRNGVDRVGICFSIKRIELGKQKPLFYLEDEIVFMFVSTSTNYLLQADFMQAMMLSEADVNWFCSDNPIRRRFEDYFKSFFNLPNNYNQTIQLSWHKNLLENQPIPLCRCLFLRVIPINHLLELLSAMVLQRKILLKSRSRCVVSGALSFLMEAVKPFAYDSPVISVLVDDLFDLIDSPTPLLIGCDSLPDEIPENSILYDIDDRYMQKFTEDVVLLPNAEEIVSSIEEIRKPLKNCENHSTHFCMTKHSQYIVWALQKIQIEFRLMVDNFEDYIETMREEGKPQVSLFRKSDYLEEVDQKYRPFLKEFSETQMFENYVAERLDNFDQHNGSL